MLYWGPQHCIPSATQCSYYLSKIILLLQWNLFLNAQNQIWNSTDHFSVEKMQTAHLMPSCLKAVKAFDLRQHCLDCKTAGTNHCLETRIPPEFYEKIDIVLLNQGAAIPRRKCLQHEAQGLTPATSLSPTISQRSSSSILWLPLHLRQGELSWAP